MPAIDTVLKWSDITADDLDGCAVGIGPGSFTGIPASALRRLNPSVTP